MKIVVGGSLPHGISGLSPTEAPRHALGASSHVRRAGRHLQPLLFGAASASPPTYSLDTPVAQQAGPFLDDPLS